MKKALVLCGGGSQGAYELGVWEYLDEIGEQFDIVVGTSIGALMGAMYVSHDFEKCVDLWETITPDKVMENGFNLNDDFLELPLKEGAGALLRFGKTYLANKGANVAPLVQIVKEHIDPKTILASKIDFGVVTTEYPSFKEADIEIHKQKEEDVLSYLLASSSCWPVFPVYKKGKKKYVDGGLNNNLPIDFALRLGAEEIVAVVLHAFPKTPQRLELTELPFVRTIDSVHDLGPFLNFDPNVAKELRTMGYLDAKKAYGKAYGKWFTFSPKPRLLKEANLFASHLFRKYYDKKKEIDHFLPLQQHSSALDYYLATLERLGKLYNLSFLKEYTLNEFLSSLRKAMVEKHPISEKDDVLYKPNLFNAIKKGDARFYASLHDHFSKGDAQERIEKFLDKNPSLYLVLSLFEVQKELFE